METTPKILLVENDPVQQDALKFVSEGVFDIEVAETPESAISRVGFEEYKLVVLDAQIDDAAIIRRLMGFFKRMHVPVMLFGERLPGANGYPVLAKDNRSEFVDKVSGLLHVVT